MTNTTFANNYVSGFGSGLFNEPVTVLITNTTIANNSGFGEGLTNDSGQLELLHTILARNTSPISIWVIVSAELPRWVIT
jgi:hypothetical protein